MGRWILIGIVALIIYTIVTGRKRNETRLAKDKREQEQIILLFKEGESLSAQQVSQRLAERTGGRKELSDSRIYTHLETLVIHEKLEEEVSPIVIDGVEQGNRRLYKKI